MTTVVEVARTLAKNSPDSFKYRIKPFLELFGEQEIGSVTALDVLEYRERLIKKYKPWTSYGNLVAAKKLIKWAASMQMRPPIDFTAVPPISIPIQTKASWLPEEVARMLSVASTIDPRAEAWGRLQYLTLARPSEVVRLVHGQFEWQTNSIALMNESKTKYPRYIVFSEVARLALDDAQKTKPARKNRAKTARPWATLNSYGHAFRMATGHRPHRLRHSAAESLILKGVERQAVDILLGHSLGNRISMTYMRATAGEYERLLPEVRLLREDLE